MHWLPIPPSGFPIGLGAWQFGAKEWGYGEPYAAQEAHAIVRRALELRRHALDTAEIYGYGREQADLGPGARRRPAVGVRRDQDPSPCSALAPVVEQRAVASNRLGARHLDLYQMHQPNPVVRDTRAMRGMRALRHVGLVGEVGVSNYSLDRWPSHRGRAGQPGARPTGLPCRPGGPGPEALELAACAEVQDRVIIAYSPLAQGLLLTKLRDADAQHANRVRRRQPAVPAGEPGPRRRADQHPPRSGGRALGQPGADRAGLGDPQPGGGPPSQARPSVEQVESNVAAADIELTDEEHSALRAAAERFRPVTGHVIPSSSRCRLRDPAGR